MNDHRDIYTKLRLAYEVTCREQLEKLPRPLHPEKLGEGDYEAKMAVYERDMERRVELERRVATLLLGLWELITGRDSRGLMNGHWKVLQLFGQYPRREEDAVFAQRLYWRGYGPERITKYTRAGLSQTKNDIYKLKPIEVWYFRPFEELEEAYGKLMRE